MAILQEESSGPEVTLLQANERETNMLAFIGHQETYKKLQDIALPAPSSLGQRMAAVLRAARRIFWNWRLASRHRPPEMHAIDHLAKHYTKVFV